MPRAARSAETVQAPSVPSSTRSTAKTVTVASKLPMALELQLCRPMVQKVQGRYGLGEETVHLKHGPIHVIRGTARPNGTLPKGFPRAPEMADGAALTPGIPADFFEQWLSQNADTEMVRNHMIFAHAERASVEDMAADVAEVRSGLDAVDPDDKDDPRKPRPMNPMVSVIETAVR